MPIPVSFQSTVVLLINSFLKTVGWIDLITLIFLWLREFVRLLSKAPLKFLRQSDRLLAEIKAFPRKIKFHFYTSLKRLTTYVTNLYRNSFVNKTIVSKKFFFENNAEFIEWFRSYRVPLYNNSSVVSLTIFKRFCFIKILL